MDAEAVEMLYDRDIREPLFDFLEETYGKIRILEEKNTGMARADVVMVTPDALTGIEIKSDADSYARLEGQVRSYDQFFDYNLVTVGTSHAMHIEGHLPFWWGIITVEEVEGQADFYMLKKPQRNPQMDPKKKMSLLWRSELAHLQAHYDMPAYSGKSRAFVADKLLLLAPQDQLWQQVSEELFERDYTGGFFRSARKSRKRRTRR